MKAFLLPLFDIPPNDFKNLAALALLLLPLLGPPAVFAVAGVLCLVAASKSEQWSRYWGMGAVAGFIVAVIWAIVAWG